MLSISKKYKRIRKILQRIPEGEDCHLCVIIMENDKSILSHFQTELINMDDETYKTTIFSENRKHLNSYHVHNGYTFWDHDDKQNRLKFLNKIIDRIEKLGK